MGTSKLLGGGNVRWTSIPSRGSRNTPSRVILQKPELSTGTDESSWLAQLLLGQTFTLPYLLTDERNTYC